MRLTTAGALVRWMIAQRVSTERAEHGRPLFPGVFAIFGHGNVTCLGHELQQVQEELPTWRGQNEQGMALAAIAFAKATRRRQIMAVTSSIGPGALNMVTAAGVAHTNRLPVLLLPGDTFVNRAPDPVLQQVEHFADPTTTANDAFRAVARYFDRITRPEQLLQSLPQALRVLLDPADCGPAVIALPQDVQAEAWDFPEALFEVRTHRIPRPRPDPQEIVDAAAALRAAHRPLIVAGGGVHYSDATATLAQFAERHGVPVAETVAGRTALPDSHPCQLGPIGTLAGEAANTVARDADVVLAVGTRLQDFTTGSWTVFADPSLTLVTVNAARFDAVKHRALPVVGDARESLVELSTVLGSWRVPSEVLDAARAAKRDWDAYLDRIGDPETATPSGLPSYAQVVAAVRAVARPHTYVMTAAGGFPGELTAGWRSDEVGSFDCEYGFSCMGYELAGAWGAAMALPDRDVITLLGDGSYLMLNSELHSAVLAGHPFLAVVCDNGGFAVIERLQVSQGGVPFNNQFATCRGGGYRTGVDFAAHARSLGAAVAEVKTIAELQEAVRTLRDAQRPAVVVIKTDPSTWTGGGAWWEVGVPEVSSRDEVLAARKAMDEGKIRQRR
jgi:3D-(3,5/4)-trihydroxycyclohexane-1,2-dione acylhydrolase (decyclizing)